MAMHLQHRASTSDRLHGASGQEYHSSPVSGGQKDRCKIHLPGAFEAVDAEKVDAQLDGALGVPDGRALVENNDAGVLEHLDHGTRAVAGRLDDLDALLDDNTCVGCIVGWYECRQERNVDGEGVRRQPPAQANLGPQLLRRRKYQSRNDTQRARVRDRRGQCRSAHVLHAALHDWDCIGCVDRMSLVR